jgi:hypothetical protein
MINHDNLAIIDFFKNTTPFTVTLFLLPYNLKIKNIYVIYVTNRKANTINFAKKETQHTFSRTGQGRDRGTGTLSQP